MDPTPTVIGARVVLRAARASDVADRMACGRDAEILRMFGDHDDHRPMTEREARAWYESLVADPNPYHWVIEHDGPVLAHEYAAGDPATPSASPHEPRGGTSLVTRIPPRPS
jgi:hypothetical protein